MKILMLSESLDEHLQPKVLNGNLVYLCHSSEDFDDIDDESITECYGIGEFIFY